MAKNTVEIRVTRHPLFHLGLVGAAIAGFKVGVWYHDKYADKPDPVPPASLVRDESESEPVQPAPNSAPERHNQPQQRHTPPTRSVSQPQPESRPSPPVPEAAPSDYEIIESFVQNDANCIHNIEYSVRLTYTHGSQQKREFQSAYSTLSSRLESIEGRLGEGLRALPSGLSYSERSDRMSGLRLEAYINKVQAYDQCFYELGQDGCYLDSIERQINERAQSRRGLEEVLRRIN